MTNTFQGILERTATVLATMLLAWLVKKGFIGESDSATLLPAIVLLPSLIYGWYINRDKAVLQAAAAISGTVVVTTPALSAATPNQNNIVSSADTKVVSK